MLIRCLFIFLLCHGFGQVSCYNEDAFDSDANKLHQASITAPEGPTDADLMLTAWKKIRDNLETDLNYFTSGFASIFKNILNQANVTRKCHQGLIYLFDQAKRKETWALKALDSWGRFPPSGILSGTLTSFGSYDQCIQIDTHNMSHHTKYCTILFRPLLPERPRYHNVMNTLKIFENSSISSSNAVDYMKSRAQFFYYTQFRLGLCLTSHCDLDEIDRIAKIVGEGMFMQGHVARCETESDNQLKLTIHQKLALLIVTVIIIVTIIATYTDLKSGLNRTLFQELLNSFSLQRNFDSLFSLNNVNSDFKCLNGIRFLTMAWIILGHTALWVHHQAFSQSFNIIDVVTPFRAQALLNPTLAVSTFFVISGLLTSYTTWKAVDGNYQKFNTIGFIVSRFARLTPCLVIAICITLFLPLMGSGPIWHEFVDPVAKNCEENWWINLIYMQAFIRPERICILPTWWLSNDMVLHVLSILILIPLMRSRKFGLASNGFLILIFTTLAAMRSYQGGYPPAHLPTFGQLDEFLDDFVKTYYFKPYLHGPPFFIGLHLGYLLAKKRYPKLTTVKVVIGWIAALLVMFAVLHAPYPLTLGKTWPTWATVLFDVTNRLAWSLALSWVIYASSSGHGGWINSFLSLPIFGPLAKMTYAVYLTHSLLIFGYMGSRRDLTDTTTYDGIHLYISHWTVAQFLGAFVTLVFESPFLNIQKLVLKVYQRKVDPTKLTFCNGEQKK